MKRSPALLALSREHHTALSLARRIAAAAEESAVAELMTAVPRRFAAELDPHFRIEEEGLLMQLAAAGEHALVERTLEEHRALRELAARVAAGERGALAPFGVALNAHVRFEERELFERAEAALPAAALMQGAEP